MTGTDTLFECLGPVSISGVGEGISGECTGMTFVPPENGTENGTVIVPGVVAGVTEMTGVVIPGDCGEEAKMLPGVLTGVVCVATDTGVFGCTKSYDAGDSGII